MLVSGGRVIAIDSVKTGNTLKGDGVFNTPGSKLDVNTDIIATKEFVTTEDEKVVGKINAASATLSSKIDSVSSTVGSVSSTLNTKINTVSSDLSAAIDKKQDQLEFKGEHDRITAIGPSGGTLSSVGGNVVDVKAGNSTTVTTATDEETGITTYTVSLTAQPTDTIVSGENGITSRQNGNTFFVGLNSTYKTNIEKIPGITSDISNLSSNKLDATAYKPNTFYPMEGNPSGFLTSHQPLTNYYTKQQVDNKFTATSSWANTTFLTKNSADGLYYPLNSNPNGYLTESDISADKWNSVYTTVNTASGGWNLISSVSALTGIRNFEKIVVDIGTQDPIVIRATGSADNLSFIQGDNILFTKEGLGVKLSAKDTTYTSGNYIVISGNNNSINAVGLQPSGDYVSATDFNEFKEQVNEEFEQTSAWVEENFLSANALDEIKDLSAKWDAASDEVTSHSANWNSVYETVKTNSGDWEEITKVKTFKTIGGIDATTSADILEFSAGENIKIGINEGKIFVSSHDTTYDENDFISASHLDNIVSVSSNVTSNSADWTSAARALEASADKWNTTHEQFNTSSVKWNELYDEYQVSSKLWNDTTDVVNTFSGDWNEVSAKANSADLEELSGKVETLSGELKTASGLIEDQIDVLSGVIDNISAVFSADIDYLSGAIDDKLDTTAFETWSAQTTEWDITPYSAGKGLALNGHEFYVSADYAMSADVYNKDEIDEKFANFGGYTTANADASGYPVVATPSTKYIYLVKMSNLPASSDNYKEWIYTSADAQTTAWECVGETTLDLTPYLTKEEAAHTYQPSGYYVTSSTDVIKPGSAWVLVNDNNNVQWSGLDVSELGKKYIVKSTNGTIGVGSATVGNVVTYDLSGATIVGENGISAEFNPVTNEWNVGLEKTNLIAFGKFHSNINTYTTSAALTGFVQEDIVGDDIYLNEGKVYVNSGLYHIDIQVEVTVPGTNNEYYNTILKSTISPTRQIQQEIDGSYAHTETIDLSFDNRYAEDGTELEFTIENLPTNSSIYVKNLNIHRIICSLAEIDGGSQYQAGDAIKIENNTINLDYGDGLELSGNKIQVKLGEGLKFDENAGVKAITINNEVEEVVETVTAIATDLDTKISNNFPPAMITVADADIAQYRNNGALYGTLFNVSINQAVEIDRSMIGMYIYRVDNDMNVVFGLYEYQPDYPRYIDDNPEAGISAYGRTVPLCDTGVVQLTTSTKGFCEWPVKHLNSTLTGSDPETRPSLKSSCMYYATIYMGSDLQAGGLHIGSFSGYAPQFNDIKPGLTIANYNINCSLGADYSSAVSFNDFGFGWKYNNYANHYAGTDNTYTTGNYSENNGGYRFYMQIRNKAKEA